MAATTFVSALADVRIGLALAFVMALSAALSLALLLRFRAGFAKAAASPKQVSSFKGTKASVRVTFRSALAGWVSVYALPSVGDDGFEVKIVSSSSQGVELEIVQRYAGRFEGLRLGLELSDVLGLFVERNLPLEVDLTFDSLPASLLAQPKRPRLSPLALGERSSGAPGSGQEFYGIDEYQPFMEAKNILWKRVGRRADDKLVVKIRESNIPREIRIAILGVDERDRLAYVDKVCEALGEVASSLLEAGSMVTFIGFGDGGPVIAGASKPEELPRALMEASVLRGLPADASILQGADILVLDSASLDSPSLREALVGRALLVISESELPNVSGRRMFVYTGHEGLMRLAELVVNR